MKTTEQQDVQAETLSGDIRDSFLTIFRDIKDPWAKLSEFDQIGLNEHVDRLARDLVRRAVNLVADRGFVHVACSYNKATLADGIKIELTAPRVSTIGAILGERPPGPAILIFADAEDFLGERAPAPVDKDQPGLAVDQEQASDLTIDQAEHLIANTDTLKGLSVRIGHLPPGDRLSKLIEAVKAKGGKIAGGLGTAPAKRSRKTHEQRIADRAAAVGSNSLPATEMPATPAAA